jgi:hypothetical protein
MQSDSLQTSLFKKKFLEGVEETVMGLLGQYAAFHEIKGRNLTCDR